MEIETIKSDVGMSWGKKNLTEICKPKQWKVISQSELTNTGYVVYGANGKMGFYHEFNHENAVLLIGCRGSCGSIHISEPFSYTNGNAMACDDLSPDVDIKFLKYFLELRGFDDIISGGVQKQITIQGLNRVEIPLPPLATQKRIAEILDAADALRRKDQELLKKYDELAQAIFINMFGDPVKNEKGWEILPISEVVHPDRIITYGIVQAGEHVNDGIPYIKTGDIKDGEILTNQLQRTSKEIALSYKRSQLYKGDIVMSIRATVGTVALLPDSLEGANLTQGTARISPSDIVDRTYLYYYLKNDFAQNWISSYAKGATFREITLSKLRQLPVLIPPIEIQSVFNKKLKTIMDSKANNKNLVKNSINLFDSLIQKAFKGELVP